LIDLVKIDRKELIMAENVIGTQLWMSATAEEPAGTQLKGITDISDPTKEHMSYEDQEIDQVNDDNSVDFEKHFDFGWTDPGEFVVTFNVSDDLRTALATMDDREDHYGEFRLPSGAKQPFIGRIQKTRQTKKPDGPSQLEVTIKVQKSKDFVPAP
jgi:hypothetical protein